MSCEDMVMLRRTQKRAAEDVTVNMEETEVEVIVSDCFEPRTKT